MVKVLLCIDYGSTNWIEVFTKKCQLKTGEPVVVEQCEWRDVSIKSVSNSSGTAIGRAYLHLRKSDNPLPFTRQSEDRDVSPDFVLFRNFPTGLHGDDFRNVLVGLAFAGVPAVNSVSSVLSDMDRPLQHAELRKVERRIASRNQQQPNPNPRITVVPMTYFSNKGDVVSTGAIPGGGPTPLPCVVKVASTNAGYGKAVARTQGELDDLVSIIAVGRDYFTVEPFLDVDHEIRIQRIGDHTRCFRRVSDSSWKNNWGAIRFVDEPLKPHHVEFADECSHMWGGLDVFALDVLVLKDGSEVLLEINSTANGLMWEHEKEDNRHIADVVLARMNEEFK